MKFGAENGTFERRIKHGRKMTKMLQKNFFNHIAFLILQAYNMLLQSGAKEGMPWLER